MDPTESRASPVDEAAAVLYGVEEELVHKRKETQTTCLT